MQRRQMTTVADRNVQPSRSMARSTTVRLWSKGIRDRTHAFRSEPSTPSTGRGSLLMSAYYLGRPENRAGRLRLPSRRQLRQRSSRGGSPSRSAMTRWCPDRRLIIANNANNGLVPLFHEGILQVEGVLPPTLRRWTSRSRRTSSATSTSSRAAIPSRCDVGKKPLPTIDVLELATTSGVGRATTSLRLVDDARRQTIRAFTGSRVLIDPHTAVAGRSAGDSEPDETLVNIAPAHPSKFGDVIRTAVGSTLHCHPN